MLAGFMGGTIASNAKVQNKKVVKVIQSPQMTTTQTTLFTITENEPTTVKSNDKKVTVTCEKKVSLVTTDSHKIEANKFRDQVIPFDTS